MRSLQQRIAALEQRATAAKRATALPRVLDTLIAEMDSRTIGESIEAP